MKTKFLVPGKKLKGGKNVWNQLYQLYTNNSMNRSLRRTSRVGLTSESVGDQASENHQVYFVTINITHYLSVRRLVERTCSYSPQIK